MKIKSKIFIIIIFSITILFTLKEVKAMLPLSGKLIIIDVGHGGLDGGSTVNGILEKDINLKISKALELELSAVGASVILTRDGDSRNIK